MQTVPFSVSDSGKNILSSRRPICSASHISHSLQICVHVLPVCCPWLDVCCSVPPDTEFPWRQVRPSASNEDMKRWTTALHSLPLRTPTMTSPAVTALTAVTASTLLPALHLPVRNNRRHTLKAIRSKKPNSIS